MPKSIIPHVGGAAPATFDRMLKSYPAIYDSSFNIFKTRCVMPPPWESIFLNSHNLLQLLLGLCWTYLLPPGRRPACIRHPHHAVTLRHGTLHHRWAIIDSNLTFVHRISPTRRASPSPARLPPSRRPPSSLPLRRRCCSARTQRNSSRARSNSEQLSRLFVLDFDLSNGENVLLFT
jgi:hypothetical protein